MWFNDDTPDPIDGELAETRAETPTNADPTGGDLSEGASTDNGSGPSANNDAWWNEEGVVPPVEGQPAPEEPIVPPATPEEPVAEPVVSPTVEEPIPTEGESSFNAQAWWNEDEPSDDDDDDEDKNKKKGDDDTSDDDNNNTDDDDNNDDNDDSPDDDENKKKDGDNKDDDDTSTKDAWWNENETPADPTGALEPGVDNGNGLAQPAEPPTPENGDPGTGVDTENQNGETVTKATDWWNEDNTPEDPTGTLPNEVNNDGNAKPAEQVPEGANNDAWWNEDDNNDDDNDLNSKEGENNKGTDEPNEGCKNWWKDDVEDPEGIPKEFGTEPVTVETPEGTVDPNGDPDPGNAVHVEGVETPAEDQPNQTAEQMLENILQTRLF